MSENTVEICGSRESLIDTLTTAANELQSQEATVLTLTGEGDAPNLRISFQHEESQESDTLERPRVRSFTTE